MTSFRAQAALVARGGGAVAYWFTQPGGHATCPLIGRLAPLDSWWSTWRHFFASWSPNGVGTGTPGMPGYGVLGLRGHVRHRPHGRLTATGSHLCRAGRRYWCGPTAKGSRLEQGSSGRGSRLRRHAHRPQHDQPGSCRRAGRGGRSALHRATNLRVDGRTRLSKRSVRRAGAVRPPWMARHPGRSTSCCSS